MTNAAVNSKIAALADMIVANVAGTDITRRELAHAFSFVENPEDWKMSIAKTLTTAEVIEAGAIFRIMEAIRFFTGSEPTCALRPDGTVRFTAPGYYAADCG